MIELQLNERIEYTMWSVFQHTPGKLPENRTAAIDETEALLVFLGDSSVSVRGLYRISGMRAGADWMIWWHAPTITALQDAYNALRKTRWGAASTPVWSSVGVHRTAEFNREHVPAYLRGEEPGRFLTVYPFVRSYEWYLLPDNERRDMLAHHGAAAKEFRDVISNTVAAFGLGDYEWILALEAEHLHRLVDLQRAFRHTDARRHVREEIPFFTGERTTPTTLIRDLP
jgi:hydrogen peroxide-dependent heme synthase